MQRFVPMQRVFVRRLQGSGKCYGKKLSQYIDNSKEIPELKGSPTIYNSTSSASNYKGYLKAKIPSGLYFNAAQSTPTGSINSETIPVSFLPRDDPRRKYVDQIRAHDQLPSANAPPVLVSKSSIQNGGEKTYHLKPEQIQEIIRLRGQDPDKYTRKKLASMYNVSPLFISLVAPASKERLQEMSSRLNYIKSKWHPKREIARADRKKRKELWYRA